MTAVIRVKRRMQDDPVEAVRLECKRKRTEEAGSSTSFEKVLNFVGTVENKDDAFCQRTLGIPPAYLERSKLYKNQKRDVMSKVRSENKARSEESRFKIISCMRSKNDSDQLDSSSEEKPQDMTILDVSIEKNQEEDGHKSSPEDGYVYDVYTAKLESEDYNDVYLDNVVGIEPYTSEVVFLPTCTDPEDCSTNPDDDDDSNDENNWRNFYPDEDGNDFEEIDVLTTDFQNFCTERGCLSSDEGEEDYLNYTDRNESFCYQEAEDLAGSSYAKYKMNVLNETSDEDDNEAI